MWKYRFLNGIFEYIDKFNADEVIIAMDAKNNWRKDFFPFYKGDRKLKRKQAETKEDGWFNYNDFFDMYAEFIEEVENNLPFKIIKIDYAEADDVAGVLTASDELQDNVKILVTTDGDYAQLMQIPLTKVYNPIKKKFMQSNDPKSDLLLKVVLGDKGDYVPSIKDKHTHKTEFLEYCVNEGVAKNPHNAKIKLENDEHLLLEKELAFLSKYQIKASRVSTFSKKLATSLIKEGKLMGHLKANPELKTRFIRNNKLINLTAQPKDLKKLILETYNDYEMKAGLNKLFDFFVLNGFNEFMSDTSRLGNILEPLTL